MPNTRFTPEEVARERDEAAWRMKWEGEIAEKQQKYEEEVNRLADLKIQETVAAERKRLEDEFSTKQKLQGDDSSPKQPLSPSKTSASTDSNKSGMSASLSEPAVLPKSKHYYNVETGKFFPNKLKPFNWIDCTLEEYKQICEDEGLDFTIPSRPSSPVASPRPSPRIPTSIFDSLLPVKITGVPPLSIGSGSASIPTPIIHTERSGSLLGTPRQTAVELENVELRKQLELARNKNNHQPYVPPFLRKNTTVNAPPTVFLDDVCEKTTVEKPAYDFENFLREFSAVANGDQKINVPEFAGESNGDVFYDWLLQVEALFSFKHYGDPKRVRLVETKLRKAAMHWWRGVQAERLRSGHPVINNWDEMKSWMETHFVPENYQQDLAERIASHMQGSMTVQEYTDEFFTLGARANIVEPETIKVGRYKRGLAPNVRELFQLFKVTTMSEAYQAALRAESILNGKSAAPFQTFTKAVSVATMTGVPKLAQAFGGKCFVCNEPGHRGADCPQKKITMTAETEHIEQELPVEERITGCGYKELMQLEELVLDPNYDYGPDCYELPLPSRN